MTGKELIIFILNNNLLDVDMGDLSNNNSIQTIEKAAVKLGIGTNSLLDMIKLGLIDCVEDDGQIYVSQNINLAKLKRR